MESRAEALKSGRIRPTKDDLRDAVDKALPDIIAPNLKVLFCGINPGLYSAAVGHHFARPGNRFWPALYASGFTERIYSPYEEEKLLDLRLGLTNLVNRATAGAVELSREELRAGAGRLRSKLEDYRPQAVAFMGIDAFRKAFERRDAIPGRQNERMGEAAVWVLPSPSGTNAFYQPTVLVRILEQLKSTSH